MTSEKKLQVILCLLLLLCAIPGCGRETDLYADSNDVNSAVAMGRYVEDITDLPESLSGSMNRLFRLTDGSLVLTDLYSPFLISRDNGATWEEEAPEWQTRMLQNGDFILNVAIGSDHTTAVVYESAADGAGGWEETKLLVLKPDGAEIPVQLAETEDDTFFRKVFIKEDGRIFASVFEQKRFGIYEVMEDGRTEPFLMLDEKEPEQICFTEKFMILYGNEYENPVVYDMEAEGYVEDETLSAFFVKNDRIGTAGVVGAGQTCLFTGKEGVFYLAKKGGLYRHVAGGNAMEQVVDGTLSVLSSPAYEIMDMLALGETEFLAVFSNRRLVRFLYDPRIPAKPAKVLKVYSLEENNTIRQAAALFQAAYPDIYVVYDIGLAGDDGRTREDALKRLNTQIMAGEGPDILIMDDMPITSYIEKGILRDLTPALESLSGEESLFPNIVGAMKTDGKVYVMPCEIQLPIIFGPEEYIARMKDLESIAGVVKELRQDSPGEDLLGVYTEEEVMRLFAMVSAPDWTTEEGKIERERITEFLEQSKRIYDAQMEGLSEEPPELYVICTEKYSGDTSAVLKVIEYAGGYLRLGVGAICDPYTYAELLSVHTLPDGEEQSDEICGWIPMNGAGGHIFSARTLIGMNARSSDQECAEAFLRLCLGVENQSSLYYGLPVCRQAFEQRFEGKTDMSGEDSFGSEFLADSEGRFYSLEVLYPDEEAVTALKECVKAADTPYIADGIVENVVYEEGSAYIQGNVTLEEAVHGIEKKLSIYLAE